MLNLHVWFGIPFFIWVHSILARVSLGWITKRMPVVWRRSGFLNHKRTHFIRKSNNVQHFCKLSPVWPAGTLKILQEAMGTINHNRANFYVVFWNSMQLHNYYKRKQQWGRVGERSLFCIRSRNLSIWTELGLPINSYFPCHQLGWGFLKSLERMHWTFLGWVVLHSNERSMIFFFWSIFIYLFKKVTNIGISSIWNRLFRTNLAK